MMLRFTDCLSQMPPCQNRFLLGALGLTVRGELQIYEFDELGALGLTVRGELQIYEFDELGFIQIKKPCWQ
jgi:hypothetical protein